MLFDKQFLQLPLQDHGTLPVFQQPAGDKDMLKQDIERFLVRNEIILFIFQMKTMLLEWNNSVFEESVSTILQLIEATVKAALWKNWLYNIIRQLEKDKYQNQTCTYLFKLFKLSIAELIQSVRMSFLHSAQSHVTDAVTHLTYIQQGWA